MKIMEIYIYGYGKFEDVKFSNLHNQQVFYGENEAGKSTIMSFIHSILFGFPTKQQTELRYEPKKGAKYGGQLTVFFPGKGKTVIERVKGKATGDVSVHIENGRIGGEELLKELLSSVDKNLFQSIFSFNLQGLQNVHQIKGEDLGRFLFSTGTVGSDRLLKAENELAKELESRFKPNGRNPLLNTKLKELRSLRTELQKAEETNEQYKSLLTKRDSLRNRLRRQIRNHFTHRTANSFGRMEKSRPICFNKRKSFKKNWFLMIILIFRKMVLNSLKDSKSCKYSLRGKYIFSNSEWIRYKPI